MTTEQKKLLIGFVHEQLIKLIFSTHFFEWDGKIFLQKEGGPIGLRSVGPVSRILMDHWILLVREVEEKSKELHRINPVMFERIEIHVLKKYVNDVFLAMNGINVSVRWDDQHKAYSWTPVPMEESATNHTISEF